jgi:hypothetical protein
MIAVKVNISSILFLCTSLASCRFLFATMPQVPYNPWSINWRIVCPSVEKAHALIAKLAGFKSRKNSMTRLKRCAGKVCLLEWGKQTCRNNVCIYITKRAGRSFMPSETRQWVHFCIVFFLSNNAGFHRYRLSK